MAHRIYFCSILCCYFLLTGGCSTLIPPGPVNAEDELVAAKKRQLEMAERAVEKLRNRKKQSRPSRVVDTHWDEDIRKNHIEQTVKREQKAVDKMPVAILRPKRPDAETIPEEEGAPEYEQQPVVGTSEHADLHAYREGLEHVKSRQWDRAVASFRRFLSEQPNHIYADRASYWVSYSHYMAGDYGLAVISSNQFEARYPQSQKVPEAIYYRALAHLELGQHEEAVPELRALMEKYPSNELVGDASKRLAEITKYKDVSTP